MAGAKAVNPDIKIDTTYLTQPPDFSGFADPAKGETAPWLAIWPTGVCLPPRAFIGASLSGLFVRHDSTALKRAHAPRSRARRAKGAAA